MIYNNQSPYTSAIVVPNREAMRQILAGQSDEASLKRAAEAISAEVDKYRTGGQYADEFPDRWLPGALAIVGEPFTEQNGLVNSTMKIVRGKVEEYFADRIEYVYTPEGKKATNPKNLESIAQIAK